MDSVDEIGPHSAVLVLSVDNELRPPSPSDSAPCDKSSKFVALARPTLLRPAASESPTPLSASVDRRASPAPPAAACATSARLLRESM